ncbi:flagellin N-terminal helical domain-containing protein [Magnetococcales bacterium HHB-1]
MSLLLDASVMQQMIRRNLNDATNSLSLNFSRLSSGLRVSSAKDDVAAFAIAQTMTTQIRGMNQAINNSNDAVSMVQVAEGALDETTDSLQRMRELAVQMSTDSYTLANRADSWEEITTLISEIERIASHTKFNTKTILQASSDYSIGYSAVIHIGAETDQTFNFTIENAGMSALGVDTSISAGELTASWGADSAQSLANEWISTVDSALDSVSDIRSGLGSIQNRFEYIISNLTTAVERTTSARSTLVDADIAEEAADMTRNSILQQAGVAVLAQANQQATLVLRLLNF